MDGFNRFLAGALLSGALGLGGCHSVSNTLGMTKVSPDEFRVVAKAPLILPPDYSLRPPAPGEPTPAELQPESAARQALLGERQKEDRSEGEKLLVTKAGGDRADPLIRYVVDDQFGALAHKDKGFADWVMFWRKGQPAVEVARVDSAASTPAPVDAAAETARIKQLTGDKPVVISRKRDSAIKLPGL